MTDESDTKRLIHWIKLSEVPAIVEKETGWRPTRQVVYYWATDTKGKRLQIGEFYPLRTTRRWVLEFLASRKVG